MLFREKKKSDKSEKLVPLVLGAQRGDSDSQQRLWQACWPEVVASCRQVLGDGLSAEEVAVEVLSDFLLCHVQNLSNPAATLAYLQLTAMRRSIKLRERINRPLYADMDRLLDDCEIAQHERAETRTLLPRLEGCLSELAPKTREVLQLRFGHDLSQEKIGELVGGSKQYLGRLIRKSLLTLRLCLERATKKEAAHEHT